MKTIYTIGHSTRPIESFILILQACGIEKVVDVRTIARSRHNPQYNEEDLRRSLNRSGIDYVHCTELGGLRHTTQASVNTGWRNASFRGYADYMQTEPFGESIAKLIDMIAGKKMVLMCAETLPWRCHRSLIADALSVRKVAVIHLISEKSQKPHTLTPFAKVVGKHITYPSLAAQPESSENRRNKAKVLTERRNL